MFMCKHHLEVKFPAGASLLSNKYDSDSDIISYHIF